MGRAGLIENHLGERASLRGGERAILVGLGEDLAELAALSATAGVQVLGRVIQRRERPDPSYFIGVGKVERLREQAALAGADTIIFGDSLSPAQSRNLEEQLERKIIDRPQLIMSIFAQHAQTKEAKLQVELAQLEYLLPRLRGWGKVLTGLGGGIGTRGPGETKLEQERRRIKRRIQRIREELEKAAKERQVKGKLRKRSGLPIVVLIGYTNSGKSTLLNKLSGATAHVEDKLFTTLAPLVRQATLPDNRPFLLVDTVGFIRKLPPQLVPAFLSSLEAVKEADLLLNVLDISNKEIFAHLATIHEVLANLFADRPWPPLINALNKVDLLADSEGEERLARAMNEMRNAVPISALEGQGLDRLLARISEELGPVRERLRLRIPYGRAALLDELHRSGRVERAEYGAEGILVEVALAGEPLRRLERRAAADGLELERLPL